jgi:hypothetical protein
VNGGKMMKRIIAFFCIITLCLNLIGCGESKDTEKIDLQNMSAAEVLGVFIKAGFPIYDQYIFAKETDPEKLLGTPHNYTSRAEWFDSRAGNLNNIGVFVEVFKNSSDCKARKQKIDQTYAMLSSVRFYSFQQGKVLLNLQCALSTTAVAGYEGALKVMAQGKMPVYMGESD